VAYERLSLRPRLRRELPTLGVLQPTANTPLEATQAPHAPRIVIVGAGMAGLTAAYYLQRYGLTADLYESSTRTGGRIYSSQGLFAPELTTELGGEFINSDHHDMLAFVKRFELTLIDAEAPSETNLRTHYFFNGRAYTEQQIIDAMRPIARRMAQMPNAQATPSPTDGTLPTPANWTPSRWQSTCDGWARRAGSTNCWRSPM
jgi:Protoporphyrinogen oxidase